MYRKSSINPQRPPPHRGLISVKQVSGGGGGGGGGLIEKGAYLTWQRRFYQFSIKTRMQCGKA